MSHHDDATLYKKLRAETIGLLGLDPATLTTAQAVRVDLVAAEVIVGSFHGAATRWRA
jgi:hypothetical protein